MSGERVWERSVLGYPISVRVIPAGRDLVVLICGGCTPHVGSVSVGYWDGDEVRVDTTLLSGHRDDVVGELYARELSRLTRGSVSVSCGIHYEGPTRADLEEIVACARTLLAKVEESLSG